MSGYISVSGRVMAGYLRRFLPTFNREEWARAEIVSASERNSAEMCPPPKSRNRSNKNADIVSRGAISYADSAHFPNMSRYTRQFMYDGWHVGSDQVLLPNVRGLTSINRARDSYSI